MKSFKKVLAASLALAMVVTAVPATTAEAATTASLNTKSRTVYAGTSKTITVKTPSTWKSAKVVASSNAKSVATVKTSGKTITVTGVKKGTAKVTVKVTAKKSGKTVKKTLAATVKVIAPKLAIEAAKSEINVGDTTTVTTSVTPADSKIGFKSLNPEIATVEKKDGVITVTGVAAGTATIKVAAKSGNTTVAKTVDVTVKESNVVKSVEAINATQLVVKFACAVDKTEAETISKYALGGATVTSAKLADDAMSVKLTLNTVELGADQIFTVQPIKTKADGTKKTALYSSVFAKYEDKVAPTATSASAKIGGTATEATSFTVTFSEPLATRPSVRVDGVTVDNVVLDAGGESATVTTNVKAGQTYKIDVYNLMDKAATPNTTAVSSTTLSVSVDTAAPVVTATAKGGNQIELAFSKAMKTATVSTAITAAAKLVKDASYKDVTYTVSAYDSANNKVVLTVDTTGLFANNATTQLINLLIPTGMEDTYGNKLVGGYMTQVTLTKDVIKPAYQKYEVTKDAAGNATGIKLTFSEDVAVKTTTPATTIVNQDGVLVTAQPTLSEVANDNKSVNVTIPGTLAGQKYTINFPAGIVADTSNNTSDAFNVSVDFGAASTTKATVLSVTRNDIAHTNVISVLYSEAVSVNATNTANYTLNGAALPAGTTITLNAARTTATITLPAGSIAANDTSAPLVVSNVVTVSGKTVETAIKTVAVVDNTAAKLASTQVSGKEITLTFTEDIDAATVDATEISQNFTIKAGDTELTDFTGASYSFVTGNAKIVRLVIPTLDSSKTITVTVKDNATIKGADGIAISK